MAEFCNQCAKSLNLPTGEFAGLGDGSELPKDFGWACLCEKCGPTVVDDDGNCIASNCLHQHGGNQ